ncbi:MAG: hypothetical protein MK074_08775 [Phycisphaerales bacterium]|nr:hypothetical protein [Phycisphaerales bacterium]
MSPCPQSRAAAVLYVLGGLIASSGCQSKGAMSEPAPASTVALSTHAAHQAKAALGSIATGVQIEAPVSFVPASGVRMSDVPSAVSTAGESVGVAVDGKRDADPDTIVLTLRTVEGWPGVISVTRRDDTVIVDATIGPWPGEPALDDRSRMLEAAVRHELRELGRIPRIEPYSVDPIKP